MRLVDKNAETSYLEKMHLFMNEGDLSASYRSLVVIVLFLGGKEAHSHVSNILHENSGIGILKGEDETEKQIIHFYKESLECQRKIFIFLSFGIVRNKLIHLYIYGKIRKCKLSHFTIYI